MKKPRDKKPHERRPARRRRRARLKKRLGPVQLWLPLQMPLALGAFVAVHAPKHAEHASDDRSPDDDSDGGTLARERAAAGQRALF